MFYFAFLEAGYVMACMVQILSRNLHAGVELCFVFDFYTDLARGSKGGTIHAQKKSSRPKDKFHFRSLLY